MAGYQAFISYSHSADGHLAPEEWLTRACAIAGRNMTADEWKLYGRGSIVRHCPELPGEGEPADYSRLLSNTTPATSVPDAETGG